MNWNQIWQFLNSPAPKVHIPLLEKGIDGLDNILAKWFGTQLINLTRIVSDALLITPTEILTCEAFRRIYTIMTFIAYAAILPLVGWIALKSITNKATPEDTLKSIGRLLLVPIGIKIMPQIVMLFLKIVNSLAQILINSTPVTINTALTANFEIGMILYLAIYLVLLITLIIFYCVRNYEILFMVSVFPLIILFYVLGQTEKMKKFTQKLSSLILTQLIYALQLVILVIMTTSLGGMNQKIPLICVQIGALVSMIKTPSWLKEYMYDVPNPMSALNKLKLKELNPTNWVKRVKRLAGIK